MTNHKSLSDAAYWDNRYHEQRDGWDLGKAHPELPTVFSYLGDLAEKRALVIGAGQGHDARAFEKRGAQVTALDFAPKGADKFKKYYPQSAVEYVIDDWFSFPSPSEPYDIVFENTLLCAIDPSRYSDYFKSLSRALGPEGIYAALIWNKTQVEKGPPFSIPNSLVEQHLKDQNFKIHAQRVVENNGLGQKDTETFFFARFHGNTS